MVTSRARLTHNKFMLDFANFELPSLADLTPLLGEIAIGGFLLILFIFSIQLVQQVRLLNIFLHTAIARVWLGLSVVLLIITVITGLWFIFV